MAKTRFSPFTTPKTVKAPAPAAAVPVFQARAAAAPGVRDVAAECRRRVQQRGYDDRPLLRNRIGGVTSRLRGAPSLSGLGQTNAVMSPTMWGLAGLTVGAGAMYLWLLNT